MADIPFSAIYPGGSTASGGGGTAVDAGAASVNAQYPGMPAGATPEQWDIALTAATPAGGTVIWQPPTDKRFVLSSLFISSDASGRIAVCDSQDIQGSRIVVQRVGANGGSSPNLVPVPYPSTLAGNALRVFSTVAGNVDIRVSGWLQGA